MLPTKMVSKVHLDCHFSPQGLEIPFFTLELNGQIHTHTPTHTHTHWATCLSCQSLQPKSYVDLIVIRSSVRHSILNVKP